MQSPLRDDFGNRIHRSKLWLDEKTPRRVDPIGDDDDSLEDDDDEERDDDFDEDR